MVLLTMIARVADGLPLAASMQEDEQVKRSVLFSSLFFSFLPPFRCFGEVRKAERGIVCRTGLRSNWSSPCDFCDLY